MSDALASTIARVSALRTCTECGLTRPITDFHKNPRMRSGRLNQCKTCVNARIARTKKPPTTPEEIAKARARSLRNYYARYRKAPNFTAPEGTHEQKVEARRIVRNAIRRGEIQRPGACERCRLPGRLHAHHADYSRPLSVEWLCHPCHKKEHAIDPDRVPDVGAHQ